MKQFISKLRMSISLLLLVGFWGISVSGTSSLIDGTAKRFPGLYRSSIDPPKDFQATIAHR